MRDMNKSPVYDPPLERRGDGDNSNSMRNQYQASDMTAGGSSNEQSEEELFEIYAPEVERRSEMALVEYLRLKAEDEALQAERKQMKDLMKDWKLHMQEVRNEVDEWSRIKASKVGNVCYACNQLVLPTNTEHAVEGMEDEPNEEMTTNFELTPVSGMREKYCKEK